MAIRPHLTISTRVLRFLHNVFGHGEAGPPTPAGGRQFGRPEGPRQTSTQMQFSILTTKTESFYTACSPELALISYGACRDEAINNLQAQALVREQAARESIHGD